jgi:hypothetical protein
MARKERLPVRSKMWREATQKLVAVSGELGDERDAQHMLRMARGDAAPCLHVERNTAAKHAVEWRPT